MTRVLWKVLIADDEPAARRGVRQLLAPFPQFDVAAECRTGADVLAALDRVQPDVIFLDIQMPGIDGFEVIRRRTPDRMPAVVFLTAYDEFALQAFDAQAVDYLVKPVSEARFAATMRRLSRQLRQPPAATSEPKFVVPAAHRTTVLPLSQIEWIEAADNYVHLWSGGRAHLLRESIRQIEPRVRPHGFARAHRRALVRIDAVRELATDAKGLSVAVLESGARVPVSRRLRAGFGKAVRGAAD